MSNRNSARLRGRLAHSFATRAGLAALLQLLLVSTAYAADEDTPLIPTAPAADAAAPAKAAAGSVAEQLEEQKKELTEQKKALTEAQEAVVDLQQKVDAAGSANEDHDWANRFKIYGFTDVGLNRVWVDESRLPDHEGQFSRRSAGRTDQPRRRQSHS